VKNGFSMRPPEILESSRLRLRRLVEDDAEAVFAAYAQDPEVTKYLVWRRTGNLEDTRHALRSATEAWDEGKAFNWVVLRKKDDRLLGMVGVRVDGHKVELGYVLAREFWRQGYMTEAVRAVVSWAIKEEDVYRVWAVCDIENLASARVMEKAGMQREGILRRWSMHPNRSEEPRDCYCYAITK
jgi:[ribosomal protein S5]-alanine N-acetyltransferase